MGRPRRDINIGPRLTAAFLAVALLTFASAVVGLVGFRHTASAAAILVQDAEMIQGVQGIRVAVSYVGPPASDYLLTGDRTARQRYETAISQTRVRLSEYTAVHSRHLHTAEHAVSLDELIATISVNVEEMAQLEQAIFEVSEFQQGADHLTRLQAVISDTNSQLDRLLLEAQADIVSAKSHHSVAEKNAFIGLAASALLATSLALLLAFAFTRSISEPLAHLVQAADRISDADLSSPVTIEATGEIGRLAAAFELMRQELARERGQLRLLAVLEERDRIGREMHDGLAQVLGYVNTKAQAVSEYLRSGEPHHAERHIGELVSAAREAYTDAREAIVGLRQEDVDRRGLSEMLAEYMKEYSRRNEVSAELVITPAWSDDRLSSTAKVQLLRIVQEALTNARKHASASQVRTSLDVKGAHAVIRVEDDGRGFNLSLLLRPDFARYGLRTMRERAQAIGGNFRIESLLGKGTTLVIRVPFSHGLETVPT
jgi:signal transduction histidine kinase